MKISDPIFMENSLIPLLRGDGEGEDGVFSENCRVIRKKETIMLQMADLMGSLVRML